MIENNYIYIYIFLNEEKYKNILNEYFLNIFYIRKYKASNIIKPSTQISFKY